MIGRFSVLEMGLPSLIEKAGFHVDAITFSPWMQQSLSLREGDYVPASESIIY